MPGLRAALGAVGAGIGVGVYFALWFGWPTFLAVAVGATLAIIMLLFAASLADDPAAADAAWRAAAPDLTRRERGVPDEPVEPAEPAEPDPAAGAAGEGEREGP